MTMSGYDRPSSPFELRHASTDRPLLVVVPERRLLTIHGAGTRGADDFGLATTMLRTVAEVVRSSLPRVRPSVPPSHHVVEITWPIDGSLTVDEIVAALDDPRQRWRQMIELPNATTESGALMAIDQTRRRGGRRIPLVHVIRLTEGRAAQILHCGIEPGPLSVRKLLGFVLEAGFRPVGDLHELVLADPASVGHGRARSILRVPIAPASEH
jgi:hypothetical protein